MATPEGGRGKRSRSPRALTLDDLPAPDTPRWVARRKALVVKGVHAGLISAAEARARYRLSDEELRSWQNQFDRHGLPGLRARQGIWR